MEPEFRIQRRFLGLLLAFIVIGLGCENDDHSTGDVAGAYACGSELQCEAARYSEERTDDMLHVNACCAVDTPDGSLEKPYATIDAAIEAAQPGKTVAIAAGIYGPSEILASVTLLGAGAERSAIVPTAGDPAALTIASVEVVAISGLMLAGYLDLLSSPCSPPACMNRPGAPMDRQALTIPASVGLLVSGTQNVTISNVVAKGFVSYLVDEGTEDEGEHGGIGILVKNSSDVILKNIEVSSNTKAGVVFSESTGEIIGSRLHQNGSGKNSTALAIIEGSSVVVGSDSVPLDAAGSLPDGGCLVEDNDAIGIFVRGSDAVLAGTKIRANLHGGAAFTDSISGDIASTIQNNLFEGNTSYGLSLVSHAADVSSNRFAGTTDCAAENCSGHCISVVGDNPLNWAQVSVKDNTVSDCAGSGILLDGNVIATVEGNTIDSVQRWGGIWAQGGVEVLSMTSNTIDASALVGIAVTTGSKAQIVGNSVNDTREGSYYDFDMDSYLNMADGIVISQVSVHAGVYLEANQITNSGRAGIIIDDTRRRIRWSSPRSWSSGTQWSAAVRLRPCSRTAPSPSPRVRISARSSMDFPAPPISSSTRYSPSWRACRLRRSPPPASHQPA